MNKKILSLVLALVMVLGTFTTVFAEEAKTEKVEKVVGKDNKIQYVIDKKFVEGYGDGDYGYDKNIKRSEITKLLVFANGNKELAEKLQGSMQLYSDVNAEYWANGVISVGSTVPSKANNLPMLGGYPDGTFKGENDVTYAELAKMLVVLVKEDLTADMAKEANKNWATQWMTWATQLGILDDVNVTNSGAAANRADAFTMLYNALYKMVEFKRVPTNDKIGVLSSLRNDKLVLNQDSEKQTYTITKDTVYVGAYKEGRHENNIVKVKDINDPDFYLGSLVRIMVNDKNEVSHILELGNPEEMAVRADANKVTDNPVWEGVADYTVETGVTPIGTLKKSTDETKGYYEGYVTFNLKDNKSSAKEINFFKVVNKDAAKANKEKAKAEKITTLKINDDTKVYVANPANNQMREVNGINEALSLIGFRNYDSGYAVPNVYAGFDNSKYDPTIKGFKNEKNTAKVIVFNVVTKDKGGDVLRVIHSSSYKGNTTLEDTDGNLKEQSFINNIAKFPYEYGDLYDVIELKWEAYNNNYDIIEKRIDHSETDDYPVVRVKEIHDNDNIVVEDRFGNEAPIYVGDADIFNAKQYKDLKVGDFLQYENDEQNKKVSNDIDTLSILPRDNRDVIAKFNDSHSIQATLKAVQGNTANGIVKEVNNTAYPYTVTIDVEYSNWDKVGRGIEVFQVAKADADKLAENIDRNVKFLFNDKDYDKDYNRMYFAFNFESNDGKALAKPAEKANDLDALLALIDKADKAYNPDKVTDKNLKQAKKDLDKINEAIKGLNLGDKAKYDNNDPYVNAVKKLEDQIKAKEADSKVAEVKAKADKLPSEEEIKKLTTQAELNKLAQEFNKVAFEYNDLKDLTSDEAKALKAQLTKTAGYITAQDAAVEPTVSIAYPLVTLK